ncbi:MAG: PH domain-containing protein [Propionicimonas sp.]|nr:PH domain-containing protein [Propionicimonas sp.]
MDDLFAPPAGAWQRLAPRAAPARALDTAIGNLVWLAAAVAAAWIFLEWWVPVLIGGLGLVWLVYITLRAWRWTRAFGFAEREHDLVISTGLWNRKLAVIPYSRMQSVQVHSGPVERLWGIAKVSLVTASVETRATIPGLTATDATRLRDRLIEAGEQQALPL